MEGLHTSDSQGSKSRNSKTIMLPRHQRLHGQRPPLHHDCRGSHHNHLDAAAKTIELGAVFARESHKHMEKNLGLVRYFRFRRRSGLSLRYKGDYTAWTESQNEFPNQSLEYYYFFDQSPPPTVIL
ncbi:hypothetical protein Golax_020626, partial [Gossypium laxum]|nr:hypothetical protein [Gossypium laxum]